MTEAADLQTIVSHGLCAGCGLCESLAGQQRVQMTITSAGRARPRIRDAIDDLTMDRIRAVCPGVTLTGPDPAQVADKGVMHDIWGPIRTMHRGWSTDEQLRYRSAAGGAVTGLGCFLLASGRVDAVVHVRASTQNPMETDAVVSRTCEEVQSGSQSRYGPAAPLRHIVQLLDEGLRFAVLAKPCDIAAVRNLGKVDARVEAQIPYLITFFCGGVASIHTSSRIAGYHGVAADEVSVFRWRGNGWPGPTHVETHDGRAFDITYRKAWFTKDVPWTYDLQFRCKICPDAIGELADVACPDSWVMVDGKPIHEEAPGANLFIARTKRGEELVAAAAAAGAIHLDPFTIEELNAQHADHVSRKVEHPARIRALGLEGQPELRVTGYRAERMAEIAGPDRIAAAEAGTRRRLRNGGHLEPLA
jgi:coenzyme F420 hydrogenase subunit beta